MLVEALKMIRAEEEDALLAVSTAQQLAAEQIEEEHRAGEEAVAATLVRAQTEISHLIKALDQKATTEAKELASTTANRQAALRARAERRLDAASKLIFERIMNV